MSTDNPSRRAAVLGSIRQSLGGARSAQAGGELDERIARHRRNLVPAAATGARRELIDRFVAKAEAVSCTVRRVADDSEVPQAVADYLRENNLPTDLAMAPDGWLQGLDWASQPMLDIHTGRPRNEDLVGLTPAFGAIAETGTLVMASGDNHPSTLNFMPDYHLVALRASQVAGGLEDLFDRLRAARADGEGFTMPRTLNMITGPSRTGDIELTIYLGAHGPRSLHIVLIDDEKADTD
jgi:L-lactate dehydrogenase complex protein LldG